VRRGGKEAFTYVLESGDEGSVHLDQVLEYNEDPTCLRDLLIYRLTVEAKERVEESDLSRRASSRRRLAHWESLGTPSEAVFERPRGR